jgi:hypothetical protein
MGFVKYGWWTAKRNPDMIVREYRNLIAERENELENFQSNKYAIKVPINFHLFNRITSNFSRPFGSSETITIDFDFEDVRKFYFQMVENHAQEVKLLDTLIKMKKELETFRRRYIYD